MGAALASAIAVASCGLELTGTGTGTLASSGEADAATDADASKDGASSLPGPDAVVEDAPDAPDAAAPCDHDRDGHMAVSCGGDDCCDTDARVHPGAGFQATASACGSFDYDCDGTESKKDGVASGCRLSIPCAGGGFDQDTACGVAASFTDCVGFGVCGPFAGKQTQQCR